MYTMVPFRRVMNNAFAPLFNDHFMREFFDMPAMPEMRVDVRENENGYLLEADLPGMKKENIDISVNDGVLTIAADMNSEKKDERKGYVCSERRCGRVERSFNLEGIDISGITADYRDGVLMVNLPKEKVEEKKNGFKIAIGGDTPKLNG